MNAEEQKLKQPGDPVDHEEHSYELYRRARAKMKSEELQEAIAYFRESFALQRHAKTAELMGECLWKQQRFSEAESILEQAVALGREARAPLILAEVLLAQKKRTEAKEMAMESLRRNPQYNPAIKFLSALSIEGA